MTIFKNFVLIDGTGATPCKDAVMKVADGRIVEIGSAAEITAEGENEIVDLKGAYVIPGMMDCHTHISSSVTGNVAEMRDFNVVDHTMISIMNLRAYLEQGVTCVRDVGSFDDQQPELTLRKYLNSGKLYGPKLLVSGHIISMTGGHATAMAGALVADGVEECRKAARAMIRDGVDLIKTVTTGGVATEGNDPEAYQFNPEELEAIVHEAHKAGKKVAAHSHGSAGIKNGVLAGIDSIEHGTLLDDDTIPLMVERGTWLVPTLVIQDVMMSMPGIPAYMVESEKKLAAHHAEALRHAYEAGVKIACGTDMLPTIVPFHVAREVELMMKASGMSAMEGIQTATKNAAELLGVDAERGTLTKGKIADFVVLAEDPLADITALRRQKAVYQAGKCVHGTV